MPTIEQLHSLLAADPNDSFLLYGLAMELARQNRLPESLEAFAKLRQQHPTYIPAWFMGARTLEQAGDIEAAKTLYQEGIALATRTGDTHAASEMSSALAMIE
ncbi:MAG TPA: hypothetical protein VHQ47_08535 [Phycisphaerae bacterium]|jgi:predicted Zn-dependent protease|nr:hypothetical protein [Phycisphaerae bacterium]